MLAWHISLPSIVALLCTIELCKQSIPARAGIAKFTQQIIIRRVGANAYAMLISLRVVFALLGAQ